MDTNTTTPLPLHYQYLIEAVKNKDFVSIENLYKICKQFDPNFIADLYKQFCNMKPPYSNADFKCGEQLTNIFAEIFNSSLEEKKTKALSLPDQMLLNATDNGDFRTLENLIDSNYIYSLEVIVQAYNRVGISSNAAYKNFGNAEHCRTILGKMFTLVQDNMFGNNNQGENQVPGLQMECIICFERPRDVLLEPCHHLAICQTCCDTLAETKCPVCQELYKGRIQVFLP